MSELLEPAWSGPVSRIAGRLAAARAEAAGRAGAPSPTLDMQPPAPRKPESSPDWGPLLVGAGCVVLCALLMAILIILAKPGAKRDRSAPAGNTAPPPAAQVQSLCSDLRRLEPSLTGTTPSGTGAGVSALALRGRAASASSVLTQDLKGLNGATYTSTTQLVGSIDAVATWRSGSAVASFSQTSKLMSASITQFAGRYC